MTPEDQQAAQVKAIEELVVYLRDLLKTRARDFVDFQLSEIAKQTEMEDSLKNCILKALDEPEKEFKVNFKPHKPTQ